MPQHHKKIPSRYLPLAFCLCLYLISLPLPLYYVAAIGNMSQAEAPDIGIAVSGLTYFLNSLRNAYLVPILCLWDCSLSPLLWLTNIAYLYCSYLYWRQRHQQRQIGLMVITVIAAVSFYFSHHNLSGRDDLIVYIVGDKGPGYFLWVASYVVLFAATLMERLHNQPTQLGDKA